MSGSSVRRLLPVAAVAGMLGVIIGAFGAHGLPDYLAGNIDDVDRLERRLEQFDTAARYHLVHAVALLAIATLRSDRPTLQVWCGGLLVAGIVLFSGSLYVLVLTDTPWLGAITPIGGVAWIIAWFLMAFLRPADRSGGVSHND